MGHTRRELLRMAAVAGGAALAGCAPVFRVPDPAPKRGPVSSGRFAPAMWDFSWATRRWGAENEYADWDRTLDGLAERGYDAVRIDAFPHLFDLDTAVILPQRPRFMWGNHTRVAIRPRSDLITFVSKCRTRGIQVGLSSWFTPDAGAHHLRVRTPTDFTRVWSRVLDALDEAGLLGAVRWVDLCNEFPLDLWAPAAADEIFGTVATTPAGAGLRALPWPQAWAARLQRYLAEAIPPLKARRPELDYCFSFQALSAPVTRTLDVSAFDVAEVHCWVSDNPAWSASSLQFMPLLELPFGAELHARRVMNTPRAELRRWADEALEPVMRTWAAWASVNELPLVTTEGWGPINYADVAGLDGEWCWVREFAELAVEKAIGLGWTGICTSNFCQPHHPGMWADAGWHRALTGAIRT